ncbi:hypothetical protein Tco_0602557 [Tanacetum coccineum]
MTTKAQQIELDNALVAPENRRVIGKCNMRINPGIKPKEPTYQVLLDVLALTTCYLVFLITTEVPVIYMHQFWATVTKHKSSYRFKIDTKKFSVNVKVFSDYSQTYVQGFRNVHATTAVDDSLLGTLENRLQTCRDTQVYGAIHYRSNPMKSQKKSDSAISSEEYPSKKNCSAQGGYLRSQEKLSASHKASDYDDGTGFESGVPDEQHLKKTGADKGTGTIPRVPDVPKYDSESEKKSWGDSGEEDEDDENDSEDKSDDGDDDDDGNDGNDGNDDDDANDDDNQEGDDMNDDDEETNSDRTESDIIKTPVLNQSSTEYYEEEEEKIDDEETMDDEEDDEVTKELYKDVNVNLGNKDTKMTNADQGGSEQQNKPSSKSAHAEELSRTVDDSGVQHDHEFNTGNNDEQPADKEVSKDDWFKKPERPPTPDSNWNKRQHVDFRSPHTWISQVAHPK